ncbi:MAG: GNAT family N-acetyltransferase [Kineosporiaceae bacterium]
MPEPSPPREPVAVARAGVPDAALAAALLHAFHAEWGDECPGEAGDAARLARLLGARTTVVLLAEVAGRPAGVAVLFLRDSTWTDAPVGTLEELYVTPDLRGRGTGTALLTALLQELAGAGVTEVDVPVDEGDDDARRFYERLGFTNTHEDGERMLYYARTGGCAPG